MKKWSLTPRILFYINVGYFDSESVFGAAKAIGIIWRSFFTGMIMCALLLRSEKMCIFAPHTAAEADMG